jgi:hypothetical protein
MWQPRRHTTVWRSTVCYRDSFTFHTPVEYEEVLHGSPQIQFNARLKTFRASTRFRMPCLCYSVTVAYLCTFIYSVSVNNWQLLISWLRKFLHESFRPEWYTLFLAFILMKRNTKILNEIVSCTMFTNPSPNNKNKGILVFCTNLCSFIW